jgi:hypothetical protein
MEYFVEYYPNADEGEQAQELTREEFKELYNMHRQRGVDPIVEHDKFSFFENGRDGQRLTILDEHGIFYG